MAEKKSKLAEIKTKATTDSVEAFINSIPHEQKRADSFAIVQMMQKATGAEAKMWGSSIIGFGDRRYKSPNTGREVDWFITGFSPRKANISLYVNIGMEAHAEALEKLGKYKTGKGCLYINKLADVDVKMLKKIIDTSAKRT
jgi:formylmethanofuran dehydrogenase subunit A